MWIDSETLSWFRAQAEREGRGYQTEMNDALKRFTEADPRPLPEIVREVLRKELRAALEGELVEISRIRGNEHMKRPRKGVWRSMYAAIDVAVRQRADTPENNP